MFKGLGDIGKYAGMLGKLKDVPDAMSRLNDRMKAERITEASPCGNVRVTMNGIGEVQDVTIDDAILGSGAGSGPAVAGAVQAATNAAGQSAKQLYARSIGDLAKEMDLDIPGIDGLLKSVSGTA